MFRSRTPSSASEFSGIVGKYANIRRLFSPSDDYSYKSYDRGYELAAKTRNILGLGENPILSVKDLVQDILGIPVVQMSLNQEIGGATIENGDARGIVVNEAGANSNMFVRRMTVTHELCHLLWDPSSKLNRLVVDSYSDLDGRTVFSRDLVEMRANAFTVSFLAPPSAVKSVIESASSLTEGLFRLMDTFGMSATAARWHVKNLMDREVSLPSGSIPTAQPDWIGRENSSLDIFKPEDTPLSRRGLFAAMVIEAFEAKQISLDTAASYLHVTQKALEPHMKFIKESAGR